MVAAKSNDADEGEVDFAARGGHTRQQPIHQRPKELRARDGHFVNVRY
jgi:hypothetical protein